MYLLLNFSPPHSKATNEEIISRMFTHCQSFCFYENLFLHFIKKITFYFQQANWHANINDYSNKWFPLCTFFKMNFTQWIYGDYLLLSVGGQEWWVKKDKQPTGPSMYLIPTQKEKLRGQQGVCLYLVGLREQCSLKKKMKSLRERNCHCSSPQGQQEQLI